MTWHSNTFSWRLIHIQFLSFFLLFLCTWSKYFPTREKSKDWSKDWFSWSNQLSLNQSSRLNKNCFCGSAKGGKTTNLDNLINTCRLISVQTKSVIVNLTGKRNWWNWSDYQYDQTSGSWKIWTYKSKWIKVWKRIEENEEKNWRKWRKNWRKFNHKPSHSNQKILQTKLMLISTTIWIMNKLSVSKWQLLQSRLFFKRWMNIRMN